MLLCRSSCRPEGSLKDQNASTEAETVRGASDFDFWPQLQHGPGLGSNSGGLPDGSLDAETPKWAANAAFHQKQQSSPEAAGRPGTVTREGATAGFPAGAAASHPEADAELLAGSGREQPQPDSPAAASAAGLELQQALQDSSAALDACLGRLLQRVQARHAAVLQQQRGGLEAVPATLTTRQEAVPASSHLMPTNAAQESSSLQLARAAADQELELLVAAAQQRQPWTSKPAPGDQQSQLAAVPGSRSVAQLDANPGGRWHHSSKHRLQLADAAWAGQVAHLRELWLDIQKVNCWLLGWEL